MGKVELDGGHNFINLGSQMIIIWPCLYEIIFLIKYFVLYLRDSFTSGEN